MIVSTSRRALNLGQECVAVDSSQPAIVTRAGNLQDTATQSRGAERRESGVVDIEEQVGFPLLALQVG